MLTGISICQLHKNRPSVTWNSLLLFLSFFLLFLAVLSLCCFGWVFFSCGSGSCSSVWCTGFSLQWPLLCWAQALGCVSFNNCSVWAWRLRLPDSRAQAQWLWCIGLVAPWHVEFSQTRDRTCVPCIGNTGKFCYYFLTKLYHFQFIIVDNNVPVS